MSDISLNQYSRLSDSLERELMRAAATGNESVSVVDLGKDTLSMLKRAAYSFAMYLVEVSRALDEARAKDARFSRSHW
jgi:hypothetical protein